MKTILLSFFLLFVENALVCTQPSNTLYQYPTKQGNTYTEVAPKIAIERDTNCPLQLQREIAKNCTSREWLAREQSNAEAPVVKTVFVASAREEANEIPKYTSLGSNTQVYPNPATEYIMLRTNDSSIKHIEIYSIIGRKVLSYNVHHDDEKYSITDLPRGLYMVRLLDANKNVIDIPRFNKNNP